MRRSVHGNAITAEDVLGHALNPSKASGSGLLSFIHCSGDGPPDPPSRLQGAFHTRTASTGHPDISANNPAALCRYLSTDRPRTRRTAGPECRCLPGKVFL